jgi:hypothetical protein
VPSESDDDAVQPSFHSVAVQQTLCLIARQKQGRIRAEQIDDALADAGVLPSEGCLPILEHMRSSGVLEYLSALRAYRLSADRERLLDRDHWGNFPVDRARWELRTHGRILARVNVTGAPDVGDVLLFGGRFWKISQVGRGTLHLQATQPVQDPLRATYDDAAPLVSGKTAERMGALATGREGTGDVGLQDAQQSRLDGLRDALSPHAGSLIAFPTPDGFRLATFAGTRANLLLATALDGHSADEVGVDLRGPDWEMLSGVTAEDVFGRAHRRWEWLARRLPMTKWAAMLPPRLARDEALSQLIGTGVNRRVADTLERPVAILDQVGFSI